MKLRDPIPGDLVRRNGGFDRARDSGWHVVTPQTPDLEALKSETSAYRRAWYTLGSPPSARSARSPNARVARLADEETRRRVST